MPDITETHLRKQRAGVYNGRPHKSKEYGVVENLLGEVMCDIVNGLTKADIKDKLTQGMYESTDKKYKEGYCDKIYRTAVLKIRQSYQMDKEDMTAVLQSRFDNLYREALESRDFGNAIRALQEFGKLVGVFQQGGGISITKDDKVTIRFGFDGEE